MKLLAIDTASRLCAACVYDTEAGRELGRSVLDLGKGHAEHLMSVVETALTEGGTTFSEIGAVAVSIGPGSFTGVRVGVSAARGFALALNIPAIGVTTLEAIAAETRDTFGARTVMSALDDGRDEINATIYDGQGMLLEGPSVTSLHDAVGLATAFSPILAGSAASSIDEAAQAGIEIGSTSATADIAVYARLAAARGGSVEKPKPLYLREADAKPQAGFVLPREGA